MSDNEIDLKWVFTITTLLLFLIFHGTKTLITITIAEIIITFLIAMLISSIICLIIMGMGILLLSQ